MVTELRPQEFDADLYPNLAKYATFMEKPSRPVLGRERQMRQLLASLLRPEVSNGFLLGDAGSGKTMLVQGVSAIDHGRIYLEIDLAKMSSSENGENGATQMSSRIKSLFGEAVAFKQSEDLRVAQSDDEDDVAKELVLFIDEFHLLVQLSPESAQSIKPLLAESGRKGIKVIGATTYAEFHEYIEKDQALMQRLQRINVRQPDKEVVLSILKSIARAHQVSDFIYDTSIYDLIYEYSNRYIPADSQPRKSILMLDSMIGWYRAFPGEYNLDRHLLGEVIYDNVGVRVSFNVEPEKIRSALNNRVLSQHYAVDQITKRLQIAVADLHDKSRPISSFLFTGPTGVGKTEMVKGMAKLLFGDDRFMIRFDMSEYALDTSLERFRDELTSRVWNNNHSVVLFDEVEKGHPSVTRLMLQMLDDGRLSNAQGREVSFLNTYIILTTNAGTEVFKDIASYEKDDKGERGLEGYEKAIRAALIANESFAPEIINRMNAIIPFQPLSNNTYHDIIVKKITDLSNVVQEIHGVELFTQTDVFDYLVYEVFDEDTDSGGARGLVSNLDKYLIAPLAAYINQFPHAKQIAVYVEGEMAHVNKGQIKRTAKIKVATKKQPKKG